MLTNVLAFLGSLPELLSMIKSFSSWINKVSGNDPAGFIKQAGVIFDQLAQAQTQEDHAAAAKALADLFSSLPAK